MLLDRQALDLPHYSGLLAGHYVRGPGYGRKRPQGTDDWLLIMTLAGRGRIGSRMGDIDAVPRSLFLLPPGSPHDYGIASGQDVWEILWVHFQPPVEWLELLRWPPAATGILMLAPQNSATIEAALRLVYQEANSARQRSSWLAMNALERLLLLCQDELPQPSSAMDSRVLNAIDFIHRNLRHPLSLEDLADQAHLSPSRFAHLFRQEAGMAPGQYVQVQRMERARRLLERTSLGIAEIAVEVGMEPFHFSTRFRATAGCSPRAYRLRLQDAKTASG